MNILDLFEEVSDAPEIINEPLLSEQDVVDYATGVLPLRRNYLHLREYSSSDKKDMFSSQSSFVDMTRKYQTPYVILILLPAAWLKDPALHPKAQELEALLAERMGFSIDRKGSTWAITDVRAEEWRVDKRLCPKCHYLLEECKCSNT